MPVDLRCIITSLGAQTPYCMIHTCRVLYSIYIGTHPSPLSGVLESKPRAKTWSLPHIGIGGHRHTHIQPTPLLSSINSSRAPPLCTWSETQSAASPSISIHLFTYPSFHPSIHLSIHLSIYTAPQHGMEWNGRIEKNRKVCMYVLYVHTLVKTSMALHSPNPPSPCASQVAHGKGG